jgi:hypothetical protein
VPSSSSDLETDAQVNDGILGETDTIASFTGHEENAKSVTFVKKEQKGRGKESMCHPCTLEKVRIRLEKKAKD